MANPGSPTALEKECTKAARVIASFRSPLDQKQQQQQPQVFYDAFVPPEVVENAAAVIALSMGRGGFLLMGKSCNGLILARPKDKDKDKAWSAPSAISIVSFGAGMHSLSEISELLLVVNHQKALDAFSAGARVSVGGSLSVNQGPTTSAKKVLSGPDAPVDLYSYAKNKEGELLRISVEGTIFAERVDLNKKMYGKKLRVKDLLSGFVAAPPQTEVVFKSLDRSQLPMTNPTPSPAEIHASVEHITPKAYPPLNPFRLPKAPEAPQRGVDSPRYLHPTIVYSVPSRGSSQVLLSSPQHYPEGIACPQPVRPITRASGIFVGTAKALYDFKPQQTGDLTFQRGDIIEILAKTDSQNDWWRGICNGRAGYFPANYTELIKEC